MIIQFYCDSGANIDSCKKSGWLDTVKDLHMEEGEWEKLGEEDRYEMCEEWANNSLEIGFEEK